MNVIFLTVNVDILTEKGNNSTFWNFWGNYELNITSEIHSKIARKRKFLTQIYTLTQYYFQMRKKFLEEWRKGGRDCMILIFYQVGILDNHVNSIISGRRKQDSFSFLLSTSKSMKSRELFLPILNIWPMWEVNFILNKKSLSNYSKLILNCS